MTNPLTILPPRLILFSGHAGTGKSTLAKRALPMIVERTGEDFFLLDKDTAYGSFSSHVMELTTGNSNDRDSPYYLENLRNWEYAGLLDIVRENLTLGVNVILVGPFSREIQNGMMFDAYRMKLPQETHIRLAWIDLNAEEARSRLLHLLDMASPPHRVFNICSGMQWGAVITRWAEALRGVHPGFIWRQSANPAEVNVPLTDTRPRGIMDIARIAATGWAPRFAPEAAYADYAAWLTATGAGAASQR